MNNMNNLKKEPFNFKVVKDGICITIGEKFLESKTIKEYNVKYMAKTKKSKIGFGGKENLKKVGYEV